MHAPHASKPCMWPLGQHTYARGKHGARSSARPAMARRGRRRRLRVSRRAGLLHLARSACTRDFGQKFAAA